VKSKTKVWAASTTQKDNYIFSVTSGEADTARVFCFLFWPESYRCQSLPGQLRAKQQACTVRQQPEMLAGLTAQWLVGAAELPT